MLKMLMIGATLLMICSCDPPTISGPVTMYEVSQRHGEAAVGKRILDYKQYHKKVGKWISPPEFIPLSEAPDNLSCFSSKDWNRKIVPRLKDASRYYRDRTR